MATATYAVTGMTCSHCVTAVTQELSKVPGVQETSVDLVVGGASTVTVVSAAPLAGDDVRAAIDEAGYEVSDSTA